MSITRVCLALLLSITTVTAGFAQQAPVAKPIRHHTHGARTATDHVPPGFPLFRCGSPVNTATGAAVVVTLSADAQRIAIGEDQVVSVRAVATGKEQWRVPVALKPISLAFSPDGSVLAISDFLGVHLRDGSTGKALRDLPEKRFRFNSIDFSKDARVLAAASQSFGFANSVRVWDVASSRTLLALTVVHDRAAFVAVAPDGKWVAIWGESAAPFTLHDKPDSIVQIWDIGRGRLIQRISCTEPVHAVAFSPDGKSLAVSSGTDTLELFAAATGRAIRTLEKTRLAEGLQRLRFSSDGGLLAATRYNDIVLWQVATGKQLATAHGPSCAAEAVAFAGIRPFACGCVGPTAHVWDALTGEMPQTPEGHSSWVDSIAFSPDGRRIITEARHAEIRLWNGVNGQREGGYSVNAHLSDADSKGPWYSTVSPGGTYVLSTRPQEGKARLLAASTGQKLRELSVNLLSLSEPAPSFSADDELLLVRSSDRHGSPTDLYETRTGKLIRRYLPEGGDLARAAIAPNHELVAFAVAAGPPNNRGVQDWRVHVYETPSGKERFSVNMTFPGYFSHATLAFGGNGEYLLAECLEGSMQIGMWETRNGHKVGQLQFEADRPVDWNLLSVSPDGRIMAVGARLGESADSIIQIWEIATGSCRREYWVGRQPAQCLAFSRDSLRLTAGLADGTAFLWDLTEKGQLQMPTTLSPGAAAEIWNQLAVSDAGTGYLAMLKMYAAPTDAVALIRDKLPPDTAKPVGQHEVARLVAKLDSPRFRERTAASAAIRRLGESAVSVLRQELKASLSPEARQRIEQLLNEIGRSRLAPERLRSMRAVETLEHIRSADSQAVLQSLARGALEAPLTRAARAALDRLNRLDSPK